MDLISELVYDDWQQLILRGEYLQALITVDVTTYL